MATENIISLDQLLEICHEDGVIFDPNELKRLADGINKRANGGKSVNDVIAVYCSAWKRRYGARPDLLGKDKSLLKGLSKDLGALRAIALVEHYLSMTTPWFVQQQHDVTTLILRHRTVSADMDGREVMTKTQAISEERQHAAASQLKRIARGEL